MTTVYQRTNDVAELKTLFTMPHKTKEKGYNIKEKVKDMKYYNSQDILLCITRSIEEDEKDLKI